MSVPFSGLSWSRYPVLRLLLPLVAGILLQWYQVLPPLILLLLCGISVLLLVAFQRLPLALQYRYAGLQGMSLQWLLLAGGAGLVYSADVRNQQDALNQQYVAGDALVLRLEEPPVQKPASLKIRAVAEGIIRNDSLLPVRGTVLLYLKKDTAFSGLTYGHRMVIRKPLQAIRNSGNPGGFDYRRYCLFQGITHQVYLLPNEVVPLPEVQTSLFQRSLYRSRAGILAILQRYIPGTKEKGLAEALLIGYKDDLDKGLVESYSDTGVVHIIAISGLHLGIIYLLLLKLTRPFSGPRSRWLRCLLILAGLWAFSLLAGAQPSVFRSTVMFSCLAIGAVLERQGNPYNTLAFSALVLLCINPFWLWDVGFQLSYSAVLSIFLFYKPVYRTVYFHNKLLLGLWQMIAVSLAAQVLTLPVTLYYFHQFPLLFLLANLVAVPLSSGVLIAEIGLCVAAVFPPLASAVGQVTAWGIRLLNAYIDHLNRIPLSVWKGLLLTGTQCLLLYVVLITGALWLSTKLRAAFWSMLASIVLFLGLRTHSFLTTGRQQQLIVYNLPRHPAIDILNGREALFLGDSAVLSDPFLYSFHLEPARVQHRIFQSRYAERPFFYWHRKRIWRITQPVQIAPAGSRPVVDLVILSGRPKIDLAQLQQQAVIKQLVLDASVPLAGAARWKAAATTLAIPCWDVVEKGAFVMQP